MILHADLFVSSMDAALDFYCEKLGFSMCDETSLSGPIVRTLSQGCYDALRLVLLKVDAVGAMLELVEFQRESALSADSFTPSRRGWVSFLVDDLDAQIRTTQMKGLSPISPVFVVDLPMSGTCRIVFYTDPDDNRLEFVQPQAPRRAKAAFDFTV